MTGLHSEPVERVERTERLAPEPAEALAALLDVEAPTDGELPELWHWIYLLERPASRQLGPDGHPTSGVPAPPGPGLRRMFAGGRVDTHRRLRLDQPATRTTWVVSEVEKNGRTGPLRFVTVRTEISQDGAVAIVEEQDIVYRAPAGALPEPEPEALPDRRPVLSLVVDEALLFRFSALTYNAHRIHYDRRWCRQEGYDDLVVHGPLQALAMGELARRNGVPLLGRRFHYRLVAPLIGPQTMQVLASAGGTAEGAEVRAADGRQTAVSTLAPLEGFSEKS
jgi:3-methylfumaryl-CoA hydratase